MSSLNQCIEERLLACELKIQRCREELQRSQARLQSYESEKCDLLRLRQQPDNADKVPSTRVRTVIPPVSEASLFATEHATSQTPASSAITNTTKNRLFVDWLLSTATTPRTGCESITHFEGPEMHDWSQPLEVSEEEVRSISEEQNFDILLWKFADLKDDESLQQFVSKQTDLNETCPGPTLERSLLYVSPSLIAERRYKDLEDAALKIAKWWRGTAILRQEWQAHLRNMTLGDYQPFTFRIVLFGKEVDTLIGASYFKEEHASISGRNNMQQSKQSMVKSFYNIPVILKSSQGRRSWGMIRQSVTACPTLQLGGSLRDLLAINNTQSCMMIVARDSGAPLWQSSASMAMMGVHGLYNRESSSSQLQNQAAAEQQNYMIMLFDSDPDMYQELMLAGSQGETFYCQLEISHPVLRSWIGLQEWQQAHHRVFITLSQDPVTLQEVYTVSQVDVTDMVIAQQETHKALAELNEERQRLAQEKEHVEGLLQRQYELIACISMVTEVGRVEGNGHLASKLIESVRMQISNTNLAERPSRKIVKLGLTGRGSYGKVYKGMWRGMTVAIKNMTLPSNMSGAEKNQRMAIMEAAISSSLSHPNIVRTYTYNLRPVLEQQQQQQQVPAMRKPRSIESATGSSYLGPGSTAGNPSAGAPARLLESSPCDFTDLLRSRPATSPVVTLGSGSRVCAVPGRGNDISEDLVNKRGGRLTHIKSGFGWSKYQEDGGMPMGSGTTTPVTFLAADPTAEARHAAAQVEEDVDASGLSECQGGSAKPVVQSLQVQIVLEYCDCGSLREALDQSAFMKRIETMERRGSEVSRGDVESSFHIKEGSGMIKAADEGIQRVLRLESLTSSSSKGIMTLDYAAILDTAVDIAKGMVHLHGCNILHSDLKAQNVLLQSNPTEPRGFTAKISDFGLSLHIGAQATHVSKVFQGTMTHMAPEILSRGHQSKASDVYAFGVTLWELYTSGVPFSNIPSTLIAYEVAHGDRRPPFPDLDSEREHHRPYIALTKRCWDRDASSRPAFEEVLAELQKLREQLKGEVAGQISITASDKARSIFMVREGHHVGGAGLERPNDKHGAAGGCEGDDRSSGALGPGACSDTFGGALVLGCPASGTFMAGSGILVAPVDSMDDGESFL
ncbi:hypothetical protein CEUSTIGMA_g5535.t1 [Chlamydomonas eustigma]|uniref:Protein kinase domain-containing protein n=1 Tax=Chlamydomonas eustigma TaxID=1157962 RepID=A0A250X4T6_9CHLO|nr:hypothetical protein CEUSTIGMA_g5535.t1 [Chlamydomonas eustigma]|eukprot:GAX78093.1 hypothetical protein CEUSTIGMA_g5535.t1 [Chlamydomonas eustigma]